MGKSKIFDELYKFLQHDAQQYIDTFAKSRGENDYILTCCLYFDSENGSVSVVILPQAIYENGVSVADVASWRLNGEWLDGPLSDSTLTLLENYNEMILSDQYTNDEISYLRQQFIDVLLKVAKQLNFNALKKSPDFMVFAMPMDEDLDIITQTVSTSLYSKYFG